MAAIVIAPDAAYFRGHFPGRPILPGVVQLILVVEHLSREAGRPLTLRSIKFARLRQLVKPHDRLEIIAREGEGGCTRVDVKRDGLLVSNAELELGTAMPHEALPRSAPVLGWIVDAPALETLLPHRPPMRFVTAIERERADGLTCTACIPSNCGLVSAASAPALSGLEAAAQTAAVWEALRRSKEQSSAGARVGYLVAIRDTELFTASIPAEEPFITTVRLEAVSLPLTHYSIEVALQGAVLLRGKIATFLTEQPAP